jgi:hypothetical protein
MMRTRIYFDPNHPNLSGRHAMEIRLRLFSATLVVSLVVLSGVVGVTAAQQRTSRTTPNQLAQQAGNDAATLLFRSGRDLITDADWAKAQDKFSQFVTAYPNDKKVDEALYWMAYAQNKQAKTLQARETLRRLLEKYPSSAWREDARLLLAQTMGVAVASPVAVPVPEIYTLPPGAVPVARAGEVASTVYAPMAPINVTPLPGQATVWGIDPPSGAADDDPCEFKIVVLQALFQTDVQRGIVAATEWLKPGSTQTVRCKSAALSLLGRNGGKAVTPTILSVARNEQDLKLRARAISALGATNDDSVVDALRDFALTSQENDIVEASLYALSKHTGERAVAVLGEIASSSGKSTSLRKVAISSIASRPGEPAVDALLRIYDADQTLEIRKAVISGFGNRRSERAGAKLVEIVRGSDVIELRKAAVSAISRRGGEKVIDTLLNLYDTEKNEEVKDQIMNALGSGTVVYSTGQGSQRITTAGEARSRVSDQRVIRKLIEIARSPTTPMERRKRAIGWLSRSSDPEVLKFLEDLLK